MKAAVTPHPGKSYILIILSVVFFATGLSRLGLGVAEVIAGESAMTTDGDEPIQVSSEAPPPPDPGDLFEALRAREQRLSAAEARLAERQQALSDAEQELARQLDRLEAAEAQLRATLRLTESAAENDLQHLTTVFESMKPPQAAELFMQMDLEFAAGFLARLRPDRAAEIMAGLDPVIAYGISAVLAGRHARTPRN